VTLTATITVQPPGTGTPYGSVTFFSETTDLGTVNLDNNGQAILVTKVLLGGVRDLTARYNGIPDVYNGSTSPVIKHTVDRATPTITTTASPTIIMAGGQVTLGAQVVSSSGIGVPSGQVTFLDNGVAISGGKVNLVNGSAQWATTFTTQGNHNITARYEGDGNFTVVTSSPPVVVTVKTANEAFVARIFQDFLNRAPSSYEASVWLYSLDRGYSRMQLALSLEYTNEFRLKKIGELYRNYVKRDPYPAEANYFLGFLQQGGTYDQIRIVILSSQEYYALQGSTSQGFLNGLYRDLPIQSIDPRTQSYYLMLLQRLTPRYTIAQLLVQSLEAKTSLVQIDYQRYLRRQPDAASLQGAAIYLANGGSEDFFIAALVGSPEYYYLG
jgi:hypothetical protein